MEKPSETINRMCTDLEIPEELQIVILMWVLKNNVIFCSQEYHKAAFERTKEELNAHVAN